MIWLRHVSAEHMLKANKDISASDTSVSMDVLLDQVDAAYRSMAWGMKEMSACCRGFRTDYTLGNLSSQRAPWVNLHQVLESCQNPQGLHLPHVISASLLMETTQVSIVAVAMAPTLKSQAGSSGHCP